MVFLLDQVGQTRVYRLAWGPMEVWFRRNCNFLTEDDNCGIIRVNQKSMILSLILDSAISFQLHLVLVLIKPNQNFTLPFLCTSHKQQNDIARSYFWSLCQLINVSKSSPKNFILWQRNISLNGMGLLFVRLKRSLCEELHFKKKTFLWGGGVGHHFLLGNKEIFLWGPPWDLSPLQR